MATSLILQLNKLIDKTPDEITKLLKNPWVQMGDMTREFYNDNRDRHVYLYNARTNPGYYFTGSLLQPREIADAIFRPLSNWGFATFSGGHNRVWYWCYAEEVVPFVIGEHDVQPD